LRRLPIGAQDTILPHSLASGRNEANLGAAPGAGVAGFCGTKPIFEHSFAMRHRVVVG